MEAVVADIAVDEEMEKLVIQIDDSSDDEEPYSFSFTYDDDDEKRSNELFQWNT